MSDYTREFKCAVVFDSPLAKTVFNWFYENTKSGSHAVGPLFTGAFYFDTCFWPLFIPLGYGTFSLNALECLESMPKALRDEVERSRADIWALALYWTDCCDYAYGVDDIKKEGKLNERALIFIENGHKELVGAIAQLNCSPPNPKAILAFRMATEIFLKALLIQERNLSDQDLRKLSHRIQDIADECFNVTGNQEFRAISQVANVFPDVSSRYTGEDRKLSEVWRAACVAQAAATTVTRRYTDRDMRPQLHRKDESAS